MESETLEFHSPLNTGNSSLPPFKLFKLPPARGSRTARYVFYFGGYFGPINQSTRKPTLSVGEEIRVDTPGRHRGS